MNGFKRFNNEVNESNVNPNAPKSELEEFRGTFSRKLFKGSGTGKKGAWQRFKLVFLNNDNKEVNFGAFDPMSPKSIQVPALVEGTSYMVLYKKSYFEQDGEQRYSKNAVLIKLSSSIRDEGVVGQPSTPTSNQPTVTSSPTTPSSFNMNPSGVYDSQEKKFSDVFIDMTDKGTLQGTFEEYMELYQKNIDKDPIKAQMAWKKYILKETN